MTRTAESIVFSGRAAGLVQAAFAIAAATAARAEGPATWLHRLVVPELRQVESRREAVTTELDALRIAPDTVHVAHLGYQLYPFPTIPETPPWLQLDLGAEYAIDCLALVPAPQPAIAAGNGGYGFPRRFRIDACVDASFATPQVVADFTREDVRHDGIEPLLVQVGGRRIRFLRLTVTGLSPKGSRWFYALGEILALAGNRNVALGAQVTASDPRELPPAWCAANVVDGRTPLGQPVQLNPQPQRAEQNGITALMRSASEARPTMVIDSGQPRIWDEVRVFGMHSSVFGTPGLRFPVRLRVEASLDEDFREAIALFEWENAERKPAPDPLTIRAPQRPLRYLRITGESADDGRLARFSLSEIQIYANGVNVALGAPAVARPHATPAYRDARDLTDGRTSLGQIVELSAWLEGWERRGSLRSELERLDARHALLVQHAEQRLIVLGALLGLVMVAAGPVFLLVARMRRRAALAALRSRLARDLHDEVGSNLAAIALLGEVAAKDAELAPAAREDWLEVNRIAQESTAAMREMLWLIGAREESGLPFPRQLEFTAQRLLRGHEIVWRRGPPNVPPEWSMDARRSFLLTFKEVLANIGRHAGATRVEISSEVVAGSLVAEICDNGRGLPTARQGGLGLRNVTQRMAEIGGSVRIENAAGGGARIVLQAVVGIPVA